jgi:hypothetical protein
VIEPVLDADREDEFWSATTVIFNTLLARRIDLARGDQTFFSKASRGVFAWCVRGGQGLNPQ